MSTISLVADVPSSTLPPLLVHELAECIAIIAIRLNAIATLWQDPQAIAQPLNVLPRSASPNLTKAALNQLPHIDLDFTSVRLADVALLDFMYDWAHSPVDRKARPLQFRAHEPSVHDLAAGENVSCAIDLASAGGFVPVLEWWFRHSPNLFFIWTEAAIDEASANGKLHVLNWWFHESGIPQADLKFSAAAMDQASGNGRDDVLEWWLKRSGLRTNQLKYSKRAMGLAAANGHVATIEWWMSSGLKLMSAYVVDYAASKDRMDVLEWCLLQPVIVEQTRFHRDEQDDVDDLVTGAIQRGSRQVLDWFDAIVQLHGRWGKIQQALASMAAARNGDLFALQWLRERGWLHGSQAQLINAAASSGCVSVLQWLQENVVDNQASHLALLDGFELASTGGFVHVLDWLVAHGYKPSKEDSYYSYAHAGGHAAVLEWWKGYPGEFYRDDLADEVIHNWTSEKYVHYKVLWPFGQRGDLNMIRWWVETAGPDYSHLIPAAVSGASYAGQMDILEYCLTHGEPLDCEDVQEAITEASKAGKIQVLAWWRNNGRASHEDFVEAFLCGVDRNRHSPAAMLWWTQVYGLDFEMLDQADSHLGPYFFPESVMSMHIAACHSLIPSRLPSDEMKKLVGTCCIAGNVSLLMYLHRSRSDFAFDAHEAPIWLASANGLVAVLEWWKHAGLKIVAPTQAEHYRYVPEVKQWWMATGLLEKS
ncbi:hypothetical protein BCR44DRAFT_1437585 [Catenaria anguillulae PL171]|uniref:Ankyrin repeat-containing domain protein n=1 Tax=Catenaria anguillulae PL171 TaxID=765915 RepID=A0A1Y2HGR4_9FUNG|nr:hypothetical protein BCR44DRAFT_1437585 [Catenaria anguillulae PL171]